MQRFLHMLPLGIQPLVVLQDMCLKKNMNSRTLQQFVHHCTSSGIAIHKETAQIMIDQFIKHKERVETIQKDAYSKMLKAGVPMEAIQQKAELEGVVWNPISTTKT